MKLAYLVIVSLVSAALLAIGTSFLMGQTMGFCYTTPTSWVLPSMRGTCSPPVCNLLGGPPLCVGGCIGTDKVAEANCQVLRPEGFQDCTDIPWNTYGAPAFFPCAYSAGPPSTCFCDPASPTLLGPYTLIIGGGYQGIGVGWCP